jgi:hypothetical protein
MGTARVCLIVQSGPLFGVLMFLDPTTNVLLTPALTTPCRYVTVLPHAINHGAMFDIDLVARLSNATANEMRAVSQIRYRTSGGQAFAAVICDSVSEFECRCGTRTLIFILDVLMHAYSLTRQHHVVVSTQYTHTHTHTRARAHTHTHKHATTVLIAAHNSLSGPARKHGAPPCVGAHLRDIL